jgi:hypothetical protein
VSFTSPEKIEAMHTALCKVCEALDVPCTPDDAASDLVALKVVEIAATGEFDPEALCTKVLQGLAGVPFDWEPLTGAASFPSPEII